MTRLKIEDDVRKVRHCIGLLNSMVRGGEGHSDTSVRMTVEALEALERIEQPAAATGERGEIVELTNAMLSVSGERKGTNDHK